MDRMMTLPVGIRIGQQFIPSPKSRTTVYKWFTLFFTFLIYCSYHVSRKPISIVKSVLHPDNCSAIIQPIIGNVSSDSMLLIQNQTHCGWAPFDGKSGNYYLGYLDIAFLFPYAIGMFVSGHIAERVNLRHFLAAGMLLSGLASVLFGFAFYWNIHSVYYFIFMQVLGGFMQSSGWPSVVTCVANWFGKGKRGLIMGIWNSHTSLGNIIGSVIAGSFVADNWGMSFIVPGAVIAGLGVLVFIFLVPHPGDIGCKMPNHLDIQELNDEEDINSQSPENACLQGEAAPLIVSIPVPAEQSAISFIGALKIPGVIEFSLCLFFAKLVSYVFLFWLPDYIYNTTQFNAQVSADLSTVFDFGGIAGGIIAGVVSDFTLGRATTCAIMLIFAVPMLFIYMTFGHVSLALNIVLLFISGFLVNGPYALITTAVSADLGTHECLHGNAKALATVTAIIDGTGSLGAAVGPFLAGLVTQSSWSNMFYMLISADIIAMLLLSRLVMKELRAKCCPSPSVISESI